MTFTAYIERQKRIIRSRHEGELVYSQDGENYNVPDCEKLLEELSSLKGLNKSERQLFSRTV